MPARSPSWNASTARVTSPRGAASDDRDALATTRAARRGAARVLGADARASRATATCPAEDIATFADLDNGGRCRAMEKRKEQRFLFLWFFL
jgi:hypothetical protein